MVNPRFSGPRAALYIERLLAALATGPMTSARLAVKLHRCHAGVAEYLVHLMDSPKRVYIKDYAPAMGRGRRAAIYALGNRRNAAETRQTRAESHRSRIRNNPDAHLAYLARRRARRSERKAKATPQSWAAALGL